MDPAAYGWLTNGTATGIDRMLNMGADPVTVTFDAPICAFGARYAQAGGHNPHHPRLRRRTGFAFHYATGALLDRFDETPGHFIVETAYRIEARDRAIYAVVIDSDVRFALIEVVARPCAATSG